MALTDTQAAESVYKALEDGITQRISKAVAERLAHTGPGWERYFKGKA